MKVIGFFVFGCLIIVLSILSSACSYETIHPNSKVSVLLNKGEIDSFKGFLFEFAKERGLTISDESRRVASGNEVILVFFLNSNGDRIAKVNGLIDRQQLDISFFECKECDLDALQSDLVKRINSSYPGSIQDVKF